MDSLSVEVNRTKDSSDGAVQALSAELRHLKIEFEKIQSREKQLLDFRSVVARMLGLDVTSLAVADYEIIARIERIITAFNNSSVVLPVQVNHVRVPTPTHYVNTTTDLSSSSSSSNILNTVQYESTSSSPSRRHHHSHSHSHSHHHHERSASPSRHHHHHHHHNSDGSVTRARSKSPRKQVTIDPNSY
jgi:hypothetical protein